MLTDIYFISNLAIWIFNLLALAISLIYCYKYPTSSYLKIFSVYLFVSLAVEILASSQIDRFFHFHPFGSRQQYAKNLFYNLYTPFELFIFAWFLYQVICSPMIKKVLVSLLIIFSIFFIAYSLRFNLGRSLYNVPIILESIIILFPCLVYFRELFTGKELVNLFKEPSFWLVTGIFFYMATIFPMFIAQPYLIASNGFTGISKSLYSINNFAIVVTYLLFIKGFTCRIKKS